MSDVPADLPSAVKDENNAHPIAGSWRPMIRNVVRCFVADDYGLETGVWGVEPVSAKTAEHVRNYIAEYGATLVDLPADSWQTSVAQWYETHWDILVDLWTAEEGRSDLGSPARSWIRTLALGSQFTWSMCHSLGDPVAVGSCRP